VSGQKTFTLRIVRRPWYEWIMWTGWLAFEMFVLQNALASRVEREPQAFLIFSVTFGVFLIGGVIVWIARRNRLLKA